MCEKSAGDQIEKPLVDRGLVVDDSLVELQASRTRNSKREPLGHVDLISGTFLSLMFMG